MRSRSTLATQAAWRSSSVACRARSRFTCHIFMEVPLSIVGSESLARYLVLQRRAGVVSRVVAGILFVSSAYCASWRFLPTRTFSPLLSILGTMTTRVILSTFLCHVPKSLALEASCDTEMVIYPAAVEVHKEPLPLHEVLP